MAILEIDEEVKRVLDTIIKYHVTSNKPIAPRFLSGYLIAAGLKADVSIYFVKIVIYIYSIIICFNYINACFK